MTLVEQLTAELAAARARVAAVEALAADDFTEADEDGDRCERLLYPRAIRAALAAAALPREDER